MRADALRSRRRILDAARDVFLESGPQAPLDLIVRRAGVGPATLYRRYPDREALVRDLTGDLLTRLAEAAREATGSVRRPDAPRETGESGQGGTDGGEPFLALRRFLHAAVDLRIGAVLPALLEGLVVDRELVRIRTETARTVDALVRAAHTSGTLRHDVGLGDLILLSIRLARPLAGTLAELDPDGELLHRHLDLALDGLAAGAATGAARGRPLTFADLVAAAARPSVP